MTDRDDEFAELDMTEDEFDRRMAAGEPVEVVSGEVWRRLKAPDLYTLVTEAPRTYGTSISVQKPVSPQAAPDINTHAVSQTQELVNS
jgi:hypothetical protein